MKAPLILAATLSAALLAGAAHSQPPLLDYYEKGGFVYLDFNPPGGRTPALRLACAKGQSRIDIAQYDGPPADGPVVLSSNGKTLSVAGKKAASAHGGDFIKAQVSPGEGPMTRFRDTGQLDVTGQGFHDHISVPDTGKGPIGRFFVSCEEGDNL